MKVLVTGAAGYLGAVLCGRLLDDGHEVVAVDSLLYDNGRAVLGHMGRPGFSFKQSDVRYANNIAALADGCEGAILLAAIVGAPACDKWPAEAVAVNQTAVIKLLDWLGPRRRVVVPCTNSGYGRCEVATEGSPLSPLSLYGKTKVEAEKRVLEHPNAVSLRLATVFGASPRMRFDLLVNDWVARLCGGRDLKVYEGHFRRNFIHVRDVADAFLRALTGSMTGAFNIGNPDCNLTKLALAHRIRSVLGLGEEWVKEGEGQDKDQRDYFVCNKKAEAAGFTFKRGLDEGIREVAQVASVLGPVETAKCRNG